MADQSKSANVLLCRNNKLFREKLIKEWSNFYQSISYDLILHQMFKET